MENQLELLREELNQLTEKDICLHSDEIVRLSQELDNLIFAYYKDITPV